TCVGGPRVDQLPENLLEFAHPTPLAIRESSSESIFFAHATRLKPYAIPLPRGGGSGGGSARFFSAPGWGEPHANRLPVHPTPLTSQVLGERPSPSRGGWESAGRAIVSSSHFVVVCRRIKLIEVLPLTCPASPG